MHNTAIRMETKEKGARATYPEGRTLDLVHLSQQSLGDRDLEIELLTLFDRQAETIAARLVQPLSAGDRKWRQDLCHTLKGSARAVGACKVAACAEAFEDALRSAASEADLDAHAAQLRIFVEEAQGVIRELIAGN
ncbi:MAG: Hpt domain-containing protein [Beijerinckiaceae bacterium]